MGLQAAAGKGILLETRVCSVGRSAEGRRCPCPRSRLAGGGAQRGAPAARWPLHTEVLVVVVEQRARKAWGRGPLLGSLERTRARRVRRLLLCGSPVAGRS